MIQSVEKKKRLRLPTFPVTSGGFCPKVLEKKKNATAPIGGDTDETSPARLGLIIRPAIRTPHLHRSDHIWSRMMWTMHLPQQTHISSRDGVDLMKKKTTATGKDISIISHLVGIFNGRVVSPIRGHLIRMSAACPFFRLIAERVR